MLHVLGFGILVSMMHSAPPSAGFEKLESRNKRPTERTLAIEHMNVEVLIYPKGYDFEEDEAMIRRVQDICESADKVHFAELIKYLRSEQYCFSAYVMGRPTSFSVGDVCAYIGFRLLTDPIGNHLPSVADPREFERFDPYGVNPATLCIWLNTNRSLEPYQIQLLLANEAMARLRKATPAKYGFDKKAVDTSVANLQDLIAQINKSKLPVFQKIQLGERFQLIDSKNASEMQRLADKSPK